MYIVRPYAAQRVPPFFLVRGPVQFKKDKSKNNGDVLKRCSLKCKAHVYVLCAVCGLCVHGFVSIHTSALLVYAAYGMVYLYFHVSAHAVCLFLLILTNPTPRMDLSLTFFSLKKKQKNHKKTNKKTHKKPSSHL